MTERRSAAGSDEAGVDRADPATAAQVGHAFTSYTQFLDADALDGARIGVWREFSFEIDGVAVDADVSAIRQSSSRGKQKASVPGRNSNWKLPLR